MCSPTDSNETDSWVLLEEELNVWAANGIHATFWWRDDDAIAAGEKLDRLIRLTQCSGLLLACIPAHAQQTLASSIAGCKHVYVAQHGYSHTNHAPRGQGYGAWELGMHRGMTPVMAELEHGKALLQDLIGEAFLPVVVPPWNRIDGQLFAPIAQIGFRGVSAFGIRDPDVHSSGLIVANAHCDPIRWKGGAIFASVHKTIMQLVEHLRARRNGQADNQEHTGFLTHHIDLDDAGWRFSEQLAAVIDSHPSARWVSPDAVFGKSL